MNKARRELLNSLHNDINEIIETLQSEDVAAAVKAKDYDWAAVAETAEEFKTRAEEIRDEEQEYFDNMPESFQNGDKGDNAQSVVSELDAAIDALELIDVTEPEDEPGEDEVDSRIDDIVGHLEEARDAVDGASGY
jgi:uncharacterized coiled-coil DUF342 family protein